MRKREVWNGWLVEEITVEELRVMPKKGNIFVMRIFHDDGCPALETHSLRDCRCNPEKRYYRVIGKMGQGKD